MGDLNQAAGRSPSSGHFHGRHDERLRDNGEGWNSGSFQENPVEHTARTACASVADARDREVRFTLELLEKSPLQVMVGRGLAVDVTQ